MPSRPVSIEVEPIGIASRAGVSVVTAVATSAPDDLDALFDGLEDALAEDRLSPADIVRNRLFAPSRELRDWASAARFARLAGQARCATSSYIDERRFRLVDGIRMDSVAIVGAGDAKIVVEHDPRQPPCRYVATGELVFLSGLTSMRPGLAAQLDEIGTRLDDTLATASAQVGGRVRPTRAAAWIHRSISLGDVAELAERVGLGGMPIEIERCDGFSKPGKLIELEVDAATVSPM
jgi:hypothetical protein